MMAKVTTKQKLVLGLTVLLLAGCGGAKSSSSDSDRLQLKNKAISIQNNSGSSVGAQALGVTPALTLVATITPPTVNSTVLQANNANISGTNVYISYNLAGTASGGGVDQINVATLIAPILQSSKIFPTMDVNAATYLGGAVYVAGNSSVEDAPARLQKYSTSLLGAFDSLLNDVALPGYASVAIKGDLLGNYLYAITGDNSGLQIIPQGNILATPTTIPLADARDISVSLLGAFNLGNVYVVTGGASGAVYGFTNSGAPTSPASVSIGNTGASQSKSTIQAGAVYAVASAGSQGVKMICLANMSIVGSAMPATTGGLTNSAAFTGGFIFTADGDGSVNVYSVNAVGAVSNVTGCNASVTLTKVGTVNFGSYVSANNISVVGSSLLFVAGGTGGFQLVSVTLPVLTTGLITAL